MRKYSILKMKHRKEFSDHKDFGKTYGLLSLFQNTKERYLII